MTKKVVDPKLPWQLYFEEFADFALVYSYFCLPIQDLHSQTMVEPNYCNRELLHNAEGDA